MLRSGCWHLLALLLWLACAAGGRAQSGRTDITLINGRLYVDLVTWGQRQGFKSRWNPTTGELQLTNRWARLGFKTDTARVEFDGVMLWLETAILKDHDRPYITQRDLDSNLRPLLQPPKLPEGKKIRRIALSAGHGGKDPGNTEGSRQEKVYTLKLAQEVEAQLKQAGFEVVQVRDRDVYVPLEDRPALANRRKADLYLAMHFNGTRGNPRSAKGAETFCLTLPNGRSTDGGRSSGTQSGNRHDRENLNLAFQIHRHIVDSVDLADRGIKRGNLSELRGVEMPAAYVEGGFMDHPDDAVKIYSDREREKLARAIVDGILAYKRLVERAQE